MMKLSNDNTQLLIKVAIGAAGLYLVGAPIARALGIVDTPKLKELTPEDEKILNPGAPGNEIPRNLAAAVADTQLAAMNRWGTDEKTLFESIETLSPAALRQVFVEFGDKWYDQHFGVASYAWYPYAQKLNLFGWYVNELSRADLKKMAAIWQKSGLTFPAIP